MKKIYLAGPISGLDYGECTAWREVVKKGLQDFGIECFSPMRDKESLAREIIIRGDYPATVMCSQRAIMARDYNDVATSNAILVNLLGACKRISTGTVMEIAWAYSKQIPVVCCIEEKDNPHDHPMVREAIDFRVDNLYDAMSCIRSLLCS